MTTQEQAMSSERSSSSALQIEIKEGIESDEEIRRVPEFGGELSGPSTSVHVAGSSTGPDPASSAHASQRRKGRNTADKEHKRLKRLLRNRVSAQQARERKKTYLSELETKVKDLERNNSELEERLSALQNENQMLRQEREARARVPVKLAVDQCLRDWTGRVQLGLQSS